MMNSHNIYRTVIFFIIQELINLQQSITARITFKFGKSNLNFKFFSMDAFTEIIISRRKSGEGLQIPLKFGTKEFELILLMIWGMR